MVLIGSKQPWRNITDRKVGVAMLLTNEKNQILSFHIIECVAKTELITGSFPNLKDEAFLVNNPLCRIEKDQDFLVTRRNDRWFYLYPRNTESKSFVFVLVAKNFEYHKYFEWCKVFSGRYYETGKFAEIVKIYLTILKDDKWCYNNLIFDFKENWNVIDYNESQLKDIIQQLGQRIIYIYTALLTKKRIVVYHNITDILIKSILALTQLSTRNPNEYLHILPNNLNDFQKRYFYLVGTNKELEDGNHCDVFVDLTRSRITVATHAKETMSLTKTHKEITETILRGAESELSNFEVAEKINEKTKALMNYVKSMARTKVKDKMMLTIADLRSKGFDKPLENFVFELANAEGLMLL